MEQVKQFLKTSPLVTLTGSGGAGKTRKDLSALSQVRRVGALTKGIDEGIGLKDFLSLDGRSREVGQQITGLLGTRVSQALRVSALLSHRLATVP